MERLVYDIKRLWIPPTQYIVCVLSAIFRINSDHLLKQHQRFGPHNTGAE